MLLPVHVSQVSVNIASGNVFLADRTLRCSDRHSDAASGEGIGVEDEVSFSIHLYIGTILFLDICPLNCFTTSIIVSSSVSLDSFSTVFWSSFIF